VQRYATDEQDQNLAARPGAVTADFRQIGLGAQILSDIGVRKMRVMSHPRRYHALSGFGLEVVEYVS
jgi:3,4-dihydroxy 2-butanone 4-phosphate synthase/GTP cyclohydrolase II